MSNDPRLALGQALRAAGLATGPRLAALALWTYADYATGAGARPAIASLATIIGRDARETRRFLRQLEDAGIVAATVVPGRATEYRFLLSCYGRGGDRDPGSGGPARGTVTRGQGDQPTPGDRDPGPGVTGTPQTQEPHEHNTTATTWSAATDAAMVVVATLPSRIRAGAAHKPIAAACLALLARGWTVDQLRTASIEHRWDSAHHAGAMVAWLRELTDPPQAPATAPPCDACSGTGWLGDDDQGRPIRCPCRLEMAS